MSTFGAVGTIEVSIGGKTTFVTALQAGTQACDCATPTSTHLLALTGGPGAGKTAVLEMASRAFCRHVAILPEAAGIVFGGGFPRQPSDHALRAAQRAIYYIQREVERFVLAEGKYTVALCDRGTLDGVAYWPGSAESFCEELGTTIDDELARYASVIHLETPSAENGYNRDNVLRIESVKEAQEIDRRIAKAWARHPRAFTIASTNSFVDKAVEALDIIRAETTRCCGVHSDH